MGIGPIEIRAPEQKDIPASMFNHRTTRTGQTRTPSKYVSISCGKSDALWPSHFVHG